MACPVAVAHRGLVGVLAFQVAVVPLAQMGVAVRLAQTGLRVLMGLQEPVGHRAAQAQVVVLEHQVQVAQGVHREVQERLVALAQVEHQVVRERVKQEVRVHQEVVAVRGLVLTVLRERVERPVRRGPQERWVVAV